MEPGKALLLVVSLTFYTSILAAGPNDHTTAPSPHELTNHIQQYPGWHGNSLSQHNIHLLIGVGVGVPLAILLIICIICLLSHFLDAPEPVLRTDFSPQRDGRRNNLQSDGSARSMPLTPIQESVV
ncbi:Hypp3930 [Branchiostoma lanceolatum]|uniref:Hypp3930 protein n=1 Tax=Branchiostoma lanceolatum TaxID=7740 RepID=A0A8K0A3J1_BRALA|nr:Hypp3930 [Branchiostoma lanceolatum]